MPQSEVSGERASVLRYDRAWHQSTGDHLADQVDGALFCRNLLPTSFGPNEDVPAGALLLFALVTSADPPTPVTVRSYLGDERPTYAWDGHRWVLADVVRRVEDVS